MDGRQPDGLPGHLEIGIGADDDALGRDRDFPDLPDHLKPRHIRHPDVGDDRVRLMDLGGQDPVPPAAAPGDDGKPFRLPVDNLFDAGKRPGLVVHQHQLILSLHRVSLFMPFSFQYNIFCGKSPARKLSFLCSI